MNKQKLERVFRRTFCIVAIIWLILVIFSITSVSASSGLHPLKKNSGGYTQELLRLAWEISPDPNWIMTLEAESGWRMDAVSPTGDHGLCQLNYAYHSQFINSVGFKDPKTQLLYCAQVYAEASRRRSLSSVFFGYNVRERTRNNFIWR